MDLWKCCAFFRGTFYRDERMQMGRVASANTGQPTSQLIVAILVEDAWKLTPTMISSGNMHPAKARWIQ